MWPAVTHGGSPSTSKRPDDYRYADRRYTYVTANLDVRRLAAVDMHGARGSRLRRSVILSEFLLGTVGGAAFGVLVLFNWGGAVGLVVGIVLLGLAANYGALALHAIALSPSDALAAELRDVDMSLALRHYSIVQFWIFVPFLFGLLAVAQASETDRAS